MTKRPAFLIALSIAASLLVGTAAQAKVSVICTLASSPAGEPANGCQAAEFQMLDHAHAMARRMGIDSGPVRVERIAREADSCSEWGEVWRVRLVDADPRVDYTENVLSIGRNSLMCPQ